MFYENAMRESPSVSTVAKIPFGCHCAESRTNEKAPLVLTVPVAAALSELDWLWEVVFPVADEAEAEAEEDDGVAEELALTTSASVISLTKTTGPIESAAFW